MLGTMDRQHYRRRLHALLTLALSVIRQDRWLLALLSGGWLRVLMDSEGVTSRTLPLGGTGARCLRERRPIVVRRPPAEITGPASLVYAPIGLGRRPPCGLLALGTFADHRYTPREVEYVAALAMACMAPVAALDKLGLDDWELATRLAAQGLSPQEASAVLGIDRKPARRFGDVTGLRLAANSRGPVPEARPLVSATSRGAVPPVPSPGRNHQGMPGQMPELSPWLQEPTHLDALPSQCRHGGSELEPARFQGHDQRPVAAAEA